MFIYGHCFYICSLSLHMLTVLAYAHCLYICSLFLYMLTVLIYAHYFYICSLSLYIVTPSFNAKTRCSSYVCPGSNCHTYGQNVSTENHCLYYIVSYYKNLLQVQKELNSRMDTILPQADDRGFRTPRRSLHQRTHHLLSSRA
jgi:hypothetical protein